MTTARSPLRVVAFALASLAFGWLAAPAARADQRSDDAALGRKVYNDLKAKYQLLSVGRNAGRRVARLFDVSPGPGFEACAPELEDVYFVATRPTTATA